MNKSEKGKFIVLYGINNIGKSTQLKKLKTFLESKEYKVTLLKYPIYDSFTGKIINKVLRSGKKQNITEEELQIWYTLNRYQFESELNTLLSEYDYVLAEDYNGTGEAWGMSKGLPLDWLENLNSRLIKPDLEILLDGKRFEKAKEAKHIHEQNNKLIETCQNNLRLLAKKNDWHVVEVIPGNINKTFEKLCTKF